MKDLLPLSLAAFVSVAFSATSFAGSPFGMIHAGKWQGAAYTTEKGAFSHCTAAAKFDKGQAIIVAENADHSWLIGVADPSWQFHDRQSGTLALTFDGQAHFEIRASVTREAVAGKVAQPGRQRIAKIASTRRHRRQTDAAI